MSSRPRSAGQESIARTERFLRPQRSAHDRMANAMHRAPTSAANRRRLLQRPAQRRHGIAARPGLDQPFKSSRSLRSVTTSGSRRRPRRRTQLGSRGPRCREVWPTVFAATPVIRDTAAMPP
jgi:hypothetical protein